jgi:opacity protein-like surface antigen
MLSITSEAAINDNGFYVRIDAGISDHVKNHKAQFKKNNVIYNVGIGYEFNYLLRADLNMQYRPTRLNILIGNSLIEQKLDSKAVMLNIYSNILDNQYFKPYFMGGVGYGSNKLNDVTRVTTKNNKTYSITNKGIKTNNFIWNVGVGTQVTLSENTMLDFSYRYLHLGSAKNKSIIINNGTIISIVTQTIKPIRANEFLIGLVIKF